MRPTIFALLTILTVLSEVSFSRTTVSSTNENEVINVNSSRSTSSSRRSRTTTQSSFRFPTDSVTRRSTNRRGSTANNEIRFPDDDNQRLEVDVTTSSWRSRIERNSTTTNSPRDLSTANLRTRTTTVSPRTTARSSVRNTNSVSSATPNVRSPSSTVSSTPRRNTTSSRTRSTTVITPTTTNSSGEFPDPYKVLESLNETSNPTVIGFDLFNSNHCPDGFLYDRATRSCRRNFDDY